MNLRNLAVTTTNGRVFTDRESFQLAALIFKRFGCDPEAATSAWRRLLGNSTTEAEFLKLVEAHYESPPDDQDCHPAACYCGYC